MTTHQTPLGKNGPRVARIGLGCMGMSEFYGPTGEKENIAVLNRALELGCNFWDTSDMYGVGLNEVLISRVIRERRKEIFICTKFGNVRANDGTYVAVNGKPDYIKRACDASLMRLGIDTIDLYYQHRVDAEVPIEETVGAMAELVKVGKVRYLGLSEAGPATIRRAHTVHPISAGQYEFSLWTRDIETEILPTLRELGIALVAYSPLGRGFLTGRFQNPDDLKKPGDLRSMHPRFQDGNFQKNRDWLTRIEARAKELHCTPAQIALAWALAKGNDIIPIPGTTKISRLEENLNALEVHLTDEDIAELDELAPVGHTSGDRYPEGAMRSTMRESI